VRPVPADETYAGSGSQGICREAQIWEFECGPKSQNGFPISNNGLPYLHSSELRQGNYSKSWSPVKKTARGDDKLTSRELNMKIKNEVYEQSSEVARLITGSAKYLQG
jgi:hypothetical protein